jgi:hypothetical protein
VLPNLIPVGYSKNKCLARVWEGRLRPRTSEHEMNHIYCAAQHHTSDVFRADTVPTRLDSQSGLVMDVTITELEEVTWSHVIWVAEEIQDSQYNGLYRIGGDREAQTPKLHSATAFSRLRRNHKDSADVHLRSKVHYRGDENGLRIRWRHILGACRAQQR